VIHFIPSQNNIGFQFINNDASVGSPDSDAISEDDMDQDIPSLEISVLLTL